MKRVKGWISVRPNCLLLWLCAAASRRVVLKKRISWAHIPPEPPIYNAAFLLSDSGKTIERIKAPDWVLNQVRENSQPVPVEEESDS